MMAFRCGRKAKSDISDTDDDGDDDVFVDSVMQKAKTGSGGRLNPRRIWRSRSKSRVASLALWTPQGDGKWCNTSGNQVVLTDVNLLSLTEAEVAILRKIAIEKLKSSDLDCSVAPPKHTDSADNESKPKRRALMLRKRAVTTGSFQSTAASKDSGAVSGQGAVFGVPLAKCIPCRRDAESRNSSTSSGVLPARELEQLRSSSGSQSAEDISGDKGLLEKSRSLAGSQTSCNIPLDINGSERFLAKQSLNLDRKSCSMVGLSALDTCPQEWGAPPEVPTPLIPNVVSTCFEHIESFGLQSLGIFRISSSKKRIRQLREDFDSGKKMNLGKEHCPHDVATLLKEYFRDLPEPLLTRELYPAFVGTQRIRNRRQQLEILRFLIQLLPVPNRDTLWALLRFLGKVALCASDYRCDTGDIIAGNKMDSNNLATLFGPNILHTAKSGTGTEKTFQVESTKRAEERIDVIKVVRSMIDNYQELFEVTASELDEVYQRMMDVNAVTLAQLLQSRLPSSELELDQDTGSSACEGSDSASLTQLPIDVTLEVISLDSSRAPEGTHRSSSQESLSSRLFRRREKSMAWGTDDEGLYWTRRKNDKPSSGSGSRSGSRSGSAEDISYKALAVEGSSRWFKKRTDKGKKAFEQEARGAFARPLRLCTEDNMRPQVSVVDIRKEQLPGGVSSGRKQSSTAVTDSPIISASLTIKVPLSRSQTGPALAFGLGRDTDIPFIEDNQSESASTASEHRHFFSSKEKLVQKRSGGGSEDEDRRRKSSQCVTNDPSKAASKGPRRSRDSFGKSASSPTSQGPSSSSVQRRQQEASGDTAQRSPASSFRWSGHGDTWKRWEIIASEHTEQETVV